jgi:hypothetical protein
MEQEVVKPPLEEEIKIVRKKPKKWQCQDCKKKYCFMAGALRHRKKKGCENHIKFKEIKITWNTK